MSNEKTLCESKIPYVNQFMNGERKISKLLVFRAYVILILLFPHSKPEHDISYYRRFNIPLKYRLLDAGKAVVPGELKHHVFVYKPIHMRSQIYQAFCSGSIVTEKRVISSSHCFLTNRKKPKVAFVLIQVVGGILTITADKSLTDNTQQWRNVSHIYSQRFFRFPTYNLAVLEMTTSWTFNDIVNKITFASHNHDYDGICMVPTIRTSTAWAAKKTLFAVRMQIIKRSKCEMMVQRTAKQFLCTTYDKFNSLSTAEIEGGGLVCYDTGDPAEDAHQGLLVGVTSIVNTNLPSLHNRIGLFHKWVVDNSTRLVSSHLFLLTCCILWIL